MGKLNKLLLLRSKFEWDIKNFECSRSSNSGYLIKIENYLKLTELILSPVASITIAPTATSDFYP